MTIGIKNKYIGEIEPRWGIRSWEVPENTAPDEMIVSYATFAPIQHRILMGQISNELAVSIHNIISDITSQLYQEQFIKKRADALNLKPVLKSALKAIKSAGNLTEEEINALNSIIGGADIQNKVDIAAICSEEYYKMSK